MLLIIKLPLMFYLNRRAHILEREYEFIQNMDCTRPLDVIDKELGFGALTKSTTNKIAYIRREDKTQSLPLVSGFGQERLSTISTVAQAVRSNYWAEPLCDATACPYHRFYLKRFYIIEDVSERRVGSEIL